MKKDFIGQGLEVGDKVVLIENKYRNFVIGVITKEHDKKFTVHKLSKDGFPLAEYIGLTTRFPSELIKVSE